MPNPILDQARARLSAIAAEKAALDVEERELRAMVAAADGVKATPAPQPFTVPWPSVPVLPSWEPVFPSPQPHPLTPWIVGAPHGGMCACPTRCPTVYCAAGTTTGISVGRHETGWIDLSAPHGTTTALTLDAMRADGWEQWGTSDVTGGPYMVKPGATWDCNPAGIVDATGVLYRN